MAKTKRRKRSSGANFALGMLVYALFFLVIGAVGLRFLWSYMEEYEKSRPNNTMDEYIQSFDEEHIKRVAADFVATLDHRVQTEEESYSYITQALTDGKLSYAKKSAESSQDKTVYIISLNGNKLGRVVLTKLSDPVFGFSPWGVAEEEMDFSWLLSQKEITVPDTWQVSCGGNVLDASYLTGEKTPYSVLEEFYGGEYEMPYMVTYRADNFVGDLSFTLTDASGAAVTLGEEDDEAVFTDNCTGEEKQELKTLTDNFVTTYVCFMSGANGFVSSNYSAVMQYVVPDSDLASRLTETIGGQVYASSRGDEIVSITINRCMALPDSNYFVDVTYVLDTTGQKGVVQTTSNLKLIASQTDGGLKVGAIASY